MRRTRMEANMKKRIQGAYKDHFDQVVNSERLHSERFGDHRQDHNNLDTGNRRISGFRRAVCG